MTPIAQQIKNSLSLKDFDPKPAMMRMAPARDAVEAPPAGARLGATMGVLYEMERQVWVVLAKRPMTLRNHPGQVAFPGGRCEPNETFLETALRETEEEVGLAPHFIEVLGSLSPVYIPPSNFYVSPFVGWHDGLPNLTPSPDEVSRIIDVPLQALTTPDCIGEINPIGDWRFPAYLVEGEKVWGATAVILSELIARLTAVDFFTRM